MAILKAAILTFVNDALHRSPALTDIDIQIQSVLDELSQGPYIEATDDDQTLEDGDEYLAKPSGYFSMISIVLNDGSCDLSPLKPFPGGYKAYRDARADAEAATASQPLYYVMWGDSIWLYPTVGQDYTVRIDYYKLHAQDVDTIEFNDDWRRAINFGAVFEVACKYKLGDYMAIWGPRYEMEKEKMRLSHPAQPSIVGA